MTSSHPYRHTLSLLRLAIDRLPPTFDGERKRFYEEKLKEFESDPNVGYGEINRVIVDFGKESWPWRRAYEDFYRTYGRSSEEAHLLSGLGSELREKYERFIHEGGKINHLESERPRSGDDLHRPTPFERYFTPEEKFAIQEALLAARDESRREIDGLAVGEKAEDYGKAVGEWVRRQEEMDGKIRELKRLATVSSRWQPEIEDRIRMIEEGWSVVERGIDTEALGRELEYWKGTLESFLRQ
ncbi:hypothetical protein JW899_01410 [Candidatus Uhrbacteria bacterium]|nr:hypothetical protein [Candidatus Uhrbacteria bacterium]